MAKLFAYQATKVVAFDKTQRFDGDVYPKQFSIAKIRRDMRLRG